MQANAQSSLRQRVRFGLILLLALVVLLGPTVSSAAPLRADTVVYVVKVGDTLRSIAAKYGTTPSAIARANKMTNPDVIYPGQRLVIPASGGSTAVPTPAPATAKPVTREGVYHTVQLGDTLDKIARAYGVTPAAIIEANGIRNADLVWVGQKLLVPGAARPATPGVAATAQPKPPATKPAASGPHDSCGAAR